MQFLIPSIKTYICLLTKLTILTYFEFTFHLSIQELRDTLQLNLIYIIL